SNSQMHWSKQTGYGCKTVLEQDGYSFETFAALCLNGRFVESARALSVPKFEFSTLNALATVALRC
ncbi:hypothetical protein, partial [uncultured Tateyamaria sp.]|uniref:hypothetical protein n=1 Tax=uncultured Tateyamaria sp. TaxID=455651 RepID=UPI002620B7DD